MTQTAKRTLLSRGTRLSAIRAATNAMRGGLTLAVLILAIAVIQHWYAHLPHMEDIRWRVLLTLLAVAAGAWIARPIVAVGQKLPRLVTIGGLIALAVSQVCFYVLIWGTWKSTGILWRAWWISSVLSVAAGHASWVRVLVSGTSPGQRVGALLKTVYVCIALAMLLVGGMALGHTPLPDTSAAYQVAMAVPLVIGWIGTAIIAIRTWRMRAPETPAWRKAMWGSIGVAAIAAVAFYLGRITAPMPTVMDMLPAGLAHLSLAELDSQLTADFHRLKILTTGLDDLTNRSDQLRQQLESTLQAEQRDYYRPAEEDQIRAAFMSYLAYRAALLRMAATYASFETIPDRSLRTRAFLTGYAAGTSVMAASEALVTTYGAAPLARKKLNERDEASGIPAGMFDQIHLAVTNDRNIDRIAEMAVYFQANRGTWRSAGLMDEPDMEWVDARISGSIKRISAGGINSGSARFAQLLRRVQSDTYTPIYAAQSVVSTLIGDTRMVGRAPFISLSQIRRMQPQLQPGDILLERRNWFMSNAFLPGFWPHAALYIGTPQELEALGLLRRDAAGRWTSDEPAIRDRLDDLLKPAHDGEPHTVIESVSEGVILNSLTESMHADYVAVLRPRKLSPGDRARAIARAFTHVGKPYDFEFDFFSADKLVCTELVYRSYDGLIRFDLIPVMGRNTLPALEIAKKFAAEQHSPNRELDFVMFLDAVPEESSARLATEADFLSAIHRPRGFNE